ncbi:amino acid ABC transporter substrate-binding protein [Bacillus tuaregi]|uniref:amino acid ABC transporter substrate-binding protein n=1 Tax=Bacillus tuaregi TaxID=1816695 RepID=UPI0008F7F760|nr:amino acid ABC transporter substrate-binding protein [Bacillus tuaregi]
MKRTGLFMLIIASVFALLVGCTSSDSGSDTGTEDIDTLVIGIDDAFAPMGFRDDSNDIVGFDIDMAKAAGEKMGVEVQFQPIDWTTKETELNSGRIDLIWNGYTVTDERKEKVLFTKPYLKNSQVVAVLADSDVATIDDLEGKQIGIQSFSSAVDALNAHPINEKIAGLTEFKTNVLALKDLENGRVDAVVIDEVVINYYMTIQEGTFKVLDESLSPEEYAVGVKKGNEALLNELQEALDTMNEDGTAAEISEKWFGEDKVLK